MAGKIKANILKAILRMVLITISLIVIILIVVLLNYNFAIDRLLKDILNALLAGLIIMLGAYLFVLRKAEGVDDKHSEDQQTQHSDPVQQSHRFDAGHEIEPTVQTTDNSADH